VEVKQALERDYDLVLSMQEIRQLTLNRLKEIDAEGGAEDGASSRRSSQPSVPEIDLNESASQIKLFVQELMPKNVLVKLNEGKSNKDTIFVVHPIEGVTLSLEKLASKVENPIYGLQCVKEADLTSVEALAKFYIKQIKSHQTKGPYTLAGYSYGCTIALEMAIQLEKETKNAVKNLIFLDGSHKYVSAQTSEYKANHTGTTSENETDALCTFLMQFLSFEYLKVRKEMLQLKTLEERINMTAEQLHPTISNVPIQDIKDAALSFYNKLVAVDKYEPKSIYEGNVVLIKALGTRTAQILGEDYSLTKVCKQKVNIHGVEGNHRSFIDFPSVEKVATVINSYNR